MVVEFGVGLVELVLELLSYMEHSVRAPHVHRCNLIASFLATNSFIYLKGALLPIAQRLIV